MPELSPQEKEVLQLARQVESLQLNPAWQAAMGALKQWRDEAMAAIEECRSSNAQVRSNLLLRWEQRRDCVRFVEGYFENVKLQRQHIIRDFAELNGHYGTDAEDVVESLM